MKAEIEVIRPGLFSTIQDMGRTGYLKYGVPLSGVMDKYAAKTGNLLLQNPMNAAVLEITITGPTLLFHGPAKIALSGADFSPEINGNSVSHNSVLSVEVGDELSFGRRLYGCRCYLSISGGFQTEKVLGSRSWYEEITTQSKLERGDKLKFDPSERQLKDTRSSLKADTEYIERTDVQGYPGPEYHLLSEQAREFLRNFKFSVSKNISRMAIQLSEELQNSLDPILTGPVLPGTVQLTPSGRLIILMRDCQTTGGYPRVLQISEKGMDTLAQKTENNEISFQF